MPTLDILQNGQGQKMSLFFGTFLRMIKSSIKTYFPQENLVVFERRHRELGLRIFYFSTFQTFLSLKHVKTARSFPSLAFCFRVKYLQQRERLPMTSLMFLICFSFYFQPFKQHYDFLIIGGGLGKHHSLQLSTQRICQPLFLKTWQRGNFQIQ